MSPVSSSDSEDEQERLKLSEALDPDFIKVTGKQQKNGGTSEGLDSKSHKNRVAEDLPVSKRPRFGEEDNDTLNYAKPYSLQVTPECQKFIAKQLTKSLDKTFKEVSRKAITSPSIESSGIKLFATSQTPITEADLSTPRRQKRPKKSKKKKLSSKSHGSDSSSESDTDKLRSVAVSADWVLNS